MAVRKLFKNLFFTLLITSMVLSLSGQTSTAPTECVRYLTPCFTTWTTDTGQYQPGFKFKVYMPEGDNIDRRPVIIFFSGGGTLSLDAVKSNCEEMVKLGYVTVAANYKDFVGDFHNPEEVKNAVGNSYILIKYLRANYVRFGIKKKKFFGVGTSAGAITWACAGTTANDTDNPYYGDVDLPDLKYCLLATASLSGALNNIYMDLVQTSSVQNNFFNGGKDLLIPVKQAQDSYEKEISFGIPSQIKIYPDADHSLGEHDDIFYNPVYGIVPTFYNKLYPPKD